MTQEASATGGSCVPHGAVARRVEIPPRQMFATLEPREDKAPHLAMYLGTLLQEISLLFRPPDSVPPLRTYSFSLRIHNDGHLSDAQPVEAYIPSALTEATLRAIDSASKRGGIGPVSLEMPQDPLPLRMVFQLGEPKSATSVPFFRIAFPELLEYETDKPALPLPGNPTPRYPRGMQEANIEGEVTTQFVVDTLGRPDMSTFRLIGPATVYREFLQAVTEVLPKMRFSPAEHRGCKVKQRMVLPFAFKLNRE
jgi:protein TonB